MCWVRCGQADERRHRRIDRPLQPGDDGADARPAAHRPTAICGPSRSCTGRRRGRRVAPTTERMTAHLSIAAASCGKTSQIWMPGTLVAIGLNSPRISAGASVLMSHMSWCGGPPPRKMLMTALWRVPDVPARASARKSPRGSDSRPHAERPDAQEAAAGDAVAQPRLLAEKCQHGGTNLSRRREASVKAGAGHAGGRSRTARGAAQSSILGVYPKPASAACQAGCATEKSLPTLCSIH